MSRVAIIILNWNGWKDTIDCLKSIEQLKGSKSVHTYVVDNGSTNESVSKINAFIQNKRNVSLIVNERNLGFAGGNNVGIKEAIRLGFEYVMILNNDTVLDSEMVTTLRSYLDKNHNVGAVSPKMYFAKGFEFHKGRYKNRELGQVIWYAGGDIDWDNVYGSNHGVDEVDTGQFEIAQETDFATGACFFVRTAVLSKVGLFDEGYFLYLEDTDLSMRIKKSGYAIHVVPKAILWHKVSRSSAVGSQLNDYFISRNRMLFGIKYAPLRAKFALIRESLRLLVTGRPWQKRGIQDYYFNRFGKGSWN